VLPPLRERLEDLPKIANHLLERLGGLQRRPLRLTAGAQRRLVQHHWPGNVRELENCLERAAVMSENGEIDTELIRIDKTRERSGRRGWSRQPAPLPSQRRAHLSVAYRSPRASWRPTGAGRRYRARRQ
jgi:Nif-specific regulatory protein